MLRRLYDWTMAKAAHPHAEWWLALFCFMEASFFPIPPHPLLGLMCVPPADVEPAPYFALLAKMAREEGLDRLSMGMSSDYETAIMLGATDVRIGTALFGERPTPARPVPASGRGMIRNTPGR